MRTTIAACAALLVAGCYTMPPPQPLYGQARINAECDMEAAKVSGYDWIDTALRRNEVRQTCLQLKASQ